jgi:clan AA aspartic protease (TIGR02281 family)
VTTRRRTVWKVISAGIGLLIPIWWSIALAESVPLKSVAGTFLHPVQINHQMTLDFTLDTGASDVSIPSGVFSTLVQAGTVENSDLMGEQIYQLADGSTQRARRFRIRSLQVGSLELHDVTAHVTPDPGVLLLGQSFLSRIKLWSIDNATHRLLLIEEPNTTVEPDNIIPNADSRWVSVGRRVYESGNKFPLTYVDTSSIRIEGNIHSAWIKELSTPNPFFDKLNEKAGHIPKDTITRYRFDCKNGTLFFLDTAVIEYTDGTHAVDDPAPDTKKNTPWLSADDLLGGRTLRRNIWPLTRTMRDSWARIGHSLAVRRSETTPSP